MEITEKDIYVYQCCHVIKSKPQFNLLSILEFKLIINNDFFSFFFSFFYFGEKNAFLQLFFFVECREAAS